jgi:hypothetical protein
MNLFENWKESGKVKIFARSLTSGRKSGNLEISIPSKHDFHVLIVAVQIENCLQCNSLDLVDLLGDEVPVCK